MKDTNSENKIFTIPNIMSMFRILLLPFILWAYINSRRKTALFLLILSWVTDILDGKIARSFHMVSSLGKVLDPLADKLTQGFLLLALISDFPAIRFPFIVFLIVQVAMIVIGILVIKNTGTTYSANWPGKIATGVLNFTVIAHIIWTNIPAAASNLLVVICVVTMLIALFSYIFQTRKRIKTGSAQ